MPTAKLKKKDQDLLAKAEALLAKTQGSGVSHEDYADLLHEYCRLRERFMKTLVISDGYQQQVKELANNLELMAAKMRQLSEMALPLCIHCHKVKADGEYWQRLETFLTRNVDIMFAHGICPDCIKSSRERLSPGKSDLGMDSPGVSRRITLRSKRHASEDKEINKLQGVMASLEAKAPELTGELKTFVDRYAKQSRRFRKTLTISDSYQMQLRDMNLRLELLARTDPLTGLANRWEMAKLLDMERSRSQRHGTAFSIILADIDHFKSVNDNFGHLAGDRVLRNLAGVLLRNMRTEDQCARWGGEEFLILLPETDEQSARNVAEKLRALVRENPMIWEGKPVRISLSLGVGQYDPDMNVDEVIKLADDAMYLAKQQGRDKVVAAKDHQ